MHLYRFYNAAGEVVHIEALSPPMARMAADAIAPGWLLAAVYAYDEQWPVPFVVEPLAIGFEP